MIVCVSLSVLCVCARACVQHPCYAPHQVIGLVKALLSQGGGGGGALKMNNIFSNSNKNELKLLLAQVCVCVRWMVVWV